MSAARVTKVFKAWHTPQLQPGQHVQRRKWRNSGADQSAAFAIAGLGCDLRLRRTTATADRACRVKVGTATPPPPQGHVFT